MTEHNTSPAPRDRILVIDEARYLLSGEKALSLNPAKDFGDAEAREFLMDLFEQMAGRKLTPEQREFAVKTGLQIAEGTPLSVGSLIRAWGAEPSLREFATALVDAAMPGPYAEMFGTSSN